MALHQELETRLRGYGLSLAQYACLELVARQPGSSPSQLARDAFVSRQAMHQLLPGLRSAGLISSHGEGRSRRLELTEEGRRRHETASSTFNEVERRMLAGLSSDQQAELNRLLRSCIDSLRSEE